MTEPDTSRLQSLEKRVERLTSVLIIQSILLTIVVLWSAFRSAPIIAFVLIVSLPLLVFYRRSLPVWARSLGRFFRQMRDATTSPPESDAPVTSETSAP